MEAAPVESTDASVVPAEDPKNNIEVEKPEHPKPKLDNFKCRICNKAFRSEPALRGHMSAHRSIPKEPKSRRHHPLRKGKKKLELPVQIIEETASSDTPPVAEGVDLLEEEIIKMNAGHSHPNYYYHPLERVELQLLPQPLLPLHNSEQHPSRPQRVTLDLLGEWNPLSGFGLGGDRGQPGTSYPENSAGDAVLEIGLRRERNASLELDLELKLGFGRGF